MFPGFYDDFAKGFSVYAANCICGWGEVFSSKEEFSGICPRCGIDCEWLLELWTDYLSQTPAEEISVDAFRALATKKRRQREAWPEVVYEDVLDADEITGLPEKLTPLEWTTKYRRSTNPSNP